MASSSTTSFEKLSILQLKSKLITAWGRYQRAAERTMAPLLYYLRRKLNAQGKKGEGFGVWVEDHVDISRRTADRWADDWAIARGLMKERKRGKTFRHLTKGKRPKPNPDGKEQIPLSFTLTSNEADAFWAAMDVLGEKAPRIIYEAVLAAATADKKPPVSEIKPHKTIFIDDETGVVDMAKGGGV